MSNPWHCLSMAILLLVVAMVALTTANPMRSPPGSGPDDSSMVDQCRLDVATFSRCYICGKMMDSSDMYDLCCSIMEYNYFCEELTQQ